MTECVSKTCIRMTLTYLFSGIYSLSVDSISTTATRLPVNLRGQIELAPLIFLFKNLYITSRDISYICFELNRKILPCLRLVRRLQ